MNSVDLIKIWTTYDKDGSGYLERRELNNFLRDLISCIMPEEKPITTDTLSEVRSMLMEELDTNDDGKIELGEFTSMMPMEKNFLDKFASRKSLSRKDFDEIFRHYDTNDNGYLDSTELTALLRDIRARDDDMVSIEEIEDLRDSILENLNMTADSQLSKIDLALILCNAAM